MITLRIGDTTKPLSKWGATSAQLNFSSFAADTFTMTTPLLRWGDVAYPPLTPCELYFNDKRIFGGYIDDATAVCSGSSGDDVTIGAKGYWSIFDTTAYVNTWINDAVSGTPYTAIYDKTKAQIFAKKYNYSGAGNGSVTQYDRIITMYSALDFLIADFVPSFTANVVNRPFGISLAAGDFGSTNNVLPFEEKQYAVFNDILQSVVKWHPDLVSWFDYSADTPLLYIRAAAKVPQSNVPVSATSERSIARKKASLPSQIRLRVAKKETDTAHGGMTWARYVRATDYVWPTGAALYAPNCTHIGFDMSEYDADELTNITINYDSLLAQMVEILSREAITGSVTLLGTADTDLSHRYVATRLNILNSRDDLANLNALVQGEQIDLMTGDRVLTLNNDNNPDVFDYAERIKYIVENTKYGTKVTIS